MSEQKKARAKHGFFSVGGPAFNGMLVVVLGALSAIVVASPSRADELTPSGVADVIPALGAGVGEVADGALTVVNPDDEAGVGTGAADGAVSAAASTGATDSSTGTSGAGGKGTTGGGGKGSVGTRTGWGALNAAVATVTTTTTAPTTPAVPALDGLARQFGANGPGSPTTRARSCDDFATQPDAQAAYDDDPLGLVNLDGDGDARACEGLPGTPPAPTTTTVPPTTSPPTTTTTTAPPTTTTSVKRWECTDFPTQPEAQVALERDPIGFVQLDGDHDGRACEGLPGTPPEATTPTTTPPSDPFVVPTKAEAVAPTSTYFGLHTLEAPWFFGEVDQLSRLVGKAPNSVLFFQNFTQPFPADAVADTWARHALPMIAWEPVRPGSTTGQPKLAEITSGSFDAYIDGWATAARDHGQPVVIRFAAEMNGDWYTWAEGQYGNQPGDYVAAWRYIHDRFTAAGATNVIWLWSANRIDHQDTPLAQVYPGDAYVDWVGMSGYYRSADTTADFATTFSATLGAIRSLSTKPIFLSETGADSGEEAMDVAWMQSFFTNLAEERDVIGFTWFNERKTLNDWRLQRGQAYVDTFAAAVADGRFGGGKLPAGMAPGDRVTLPAAREEDTEVVPTPTATPTTTPTTTPTSTTTTSPATTTRTIVTSPSTTTTTLV